MTRKRASEPTGPVFVRGVRKRSQRRNPRRAIEALAHVQFDSEDGSVRIPDDLYPKGWLEAANEPDTLALADDSEADE